MRFHICVASEPFPKGRRIILGDIEGREWGEYGRVKTFADIKSTTVPLQTARDREWSKAISIVYDARPAVERLSGDEIRPKRLDQLTAELLASEFESEEQRALQFVELSRGSQPLL